ncbi:hypothetical protein DPMN_175250 [Dreissena polymorpha]|uniref:Uncharacterized protein n=1 Tax=Dreissena polymorpha TaxID=45954 RepID=A0A9D4E7T5_DREPO|nr:hypothetical protein DPMN_175250 [Dreissena polymorpha]
MTLILPAPNGLPSSGETDTPCFNKMGITTEAWRARIGTFSQPAAKTKSNFKTLQITHMNPGPGPDLRERLPRQKSLGRSTNRDIRPDRECLTTVRTSQQPGPSDRDRDTNQLSLNNWFTKRKSANERRRR